MPRLWPSQTTTEMASGAAQCRCQKALRATTSSSTAPTTVAIGELQNLDGLECSDPANYNDRILAPLTGNTTISTCFGQCSTDGTCAAPAETYDVTFQVDMSTYEGAFGTVNLNGNFNGWCGGCAEMTDADGDGVYSLTVPLSAGSIEYKFTLDGWTAQEEFAGGESCTVTDGTFVNRGYRLLAKPPWMWFATTAAMRVTVLEAVATQSA